MAEDPDLMKTPQPRIPTESPEGIPPLGSDFFDDPPRLLMNSCSLRQESGTPVMQISPYPNQRTASCSNPIEAKPDTLKAKP